MERFAFKIDDVLRANLYKICRLCGIDNPDQVPILRENEAEVFDVDSEPELSQKIHDCIGFWISKDDKMPQMICSLCVEKINDFYEFREMCFATNIQTRNLLGLKDEPKNLEVKLNLKTEIPITDKVEKRGRKRKSDELDFEIKIEDKKPKSGFNANLSKKKVPLNYIKNKNQFGNSENFKMEFKNEYGVEMDHIADIEYMKLKQICRICKQRFESKYKLDRHKFLEHTPNIPRYVCSTCDETLKMNSEIKSHQLWHKLSKTPYTCALCRETMSSVNLYTRHLRDHAQKLATPLIVLDRECGLCHKTFCTNFLYNTHACAVRTRKCGGCGRQLKSEVEFLRHTPTCEKVYLMISNHLTAALEPVKIKNENEVEAAAESLSMAPTIPISDGSLKQSGLDINLKPSDETLLNKSSKKSGKKGISKNYLKRVDDLLKSTMDTLVSIKHEPEMHVDSDVQNHTKQSDKFVASSDETLAPESFNDDYSQNRDDDSDEEDAGPFVPLVQLQTGNEVVIKQEPLENENSKTTNLLQDVIVSVKKEPSDSGYEDSSATGSVGKIPVLKLKITKEHGTLNSSLVDENSTCREKKKKKKKRKDTDKLNEQDDDENPQENHLETSSVSPPKINEFSAMPQPGIIRIKQERFDDDYVEGNISHEVQDSSFNYSTVDSAQPEATVMTSIPMMQLQISCVSSGVDFNETNVEGEALDIKPNRAELEQWLQSTNSGTVTPTGDDFGSSTHILGQSHNQTIKKMQCRSKAVKSTGGVSHRNNNNQEIPKIIAVTSGVDPITSQNENNEDASGFALSKVSIKAEPCYEGYEYDRPTEGQTNTNNEMESSLRTQDHDDHLNDRDQRFYNKNVDIFNISIKQEKDIDISESQMTVQQFSTQLYNGAEEVSRTPTFEVNNEFEHRATNDPEVGEEDDDDEEDIRIEREENSEREYRELEWPPLLSDSKSDVAERDLKAPGIIITDVCSHAVRQLDESVGSDKVTLSKEQLAKRQQSNKNIGSDLEGTCSLNSVMLQSDTSIALEKNISKLNERSVKFTYEEESTNSSPEPSFKTNHESIAEGTTSSRSKSEKLLKITQKLSEEAECIANESSDRPESGTETLSLKIIENASHLLKTSPHTKSIDDENIQPNSRFQSVDEEQQNILNHEVLANNEIEPNDGTSRVHTIDQATRRRLSSNEPSSSLEQPSEGKSTTSTTLTECNEETDNLFNESVDHRRQQQVQGSMQRAVLLDDSNINEIAENNNNANIERELLDDNSNNTERMSPSSTVNQETNHESF